MANVNITHITCCECGISFWVPTEFNQQLLKRQNTFYCPSGHPQSYTGKTDVQIVLQVAYPPNPALTF